MGGIVRIHLSDSEEIKMQTFPKLLMALFDDNKIKKEKKISCLIIGEQNINSQSMMQIQIQDIFFFLISSIL